MPDSKKKVKVLSEEEQLRIDFKKNKLYRLLLEDQRSASTPEKRKRAKDEIEKFFEYFKKNELTIKKLKEN